MSRRKMTAEEVWRILWNAPREGGRTLKPVEVLMAAGCGKSTAIKLIRDLAHFHTKALLPHLESHRWETMTAVTMLKEPPSEKNPAGTAHPQTAVKISTPKTEQEKVSPYQARVSRVIVLVDRDNIMIPLQRSLKREFPFEEVLRFAARNGGLEAAFFFCPLGTEKDEILLFRRHGFHIVIGQSVKEGQDRVDKSLEDVGKLLLKNPDVGMLVILSEDRDFSDLFAFAVGNGKRAFQFRVNVQKCTLRSTDYTEEIPIPIDNEMKALTTRPRTAWQAIKN